jgi:predicted RNase H-like HicB family nuclease
MCRVSSRCTILARKGYAVGRVGNGGCAVREPKYKYEIDIFWSDEDGFFIACVPDLENCAAWGNNYEEALAQAHVAIRADLVSRQKCGEPIPDPSLRVPA